MAIRFLDAYLAYTYGRAARLTDHAAAPALVRTLDAAPPAIPAAIQRRQPRITALVLDWAGPTSATATATINDDTATYPVVVELTRLRDGRFIATAVRP